MQPDFVVRFSVRSLTYYIAKPLHGVKTWYADFKPYAFCVYIGFLLKQEAFMQSGYALCKVTKYRKLVFVAVEKFFIHTFVR